MWIVIEEARVFSAMPKTLMTQCRCIMPSYHLPPWLSRNRPDTMLNIDIIAAIWQEEYRDSGTRSPIAQNVYTSRGGYVQMRHFVMVSTSFLIRLCPAILYPVWKTSKSRPPLMCSSLSSRPASRLSVLQNVLVAGESRVGNASKRL